MANVFYNMRVILKRLSFESAEFIRWRMLFNNIRVIWLKSIVLSYRLVDLKWMF